MPYRQNFPIPSVIDPPKICLQLEIPDHPEWKRVIAGLLFELSYWFNWERTGDDSGARCAAVWKQVYSSIDWSGMSCCCEEKAQVQRINPITGRMEVSTDGGNTWRADPGGFPSIIVQPVPPVTSGVAATKCDAATNVSGQVDYWIEHVSDNFDTAVTILEFASGVILAIAGAVLTILTEGAFAPIELKLIAALGAALFAAWGAGKTFFDNYWTTEVKDDIFCAAYCNIGEDGSFTDAQFSAFWNEVNQKLPGSPVKMLFMGFLSSVGAPGLNAMAASGTSADGDCEDCDCVPGCDNDWIVYPSSPNYFGIIVEQTPTYVIVKTDVINVNSLYYTYLVADPPENCCVINHVQYFLETTDEEQMTYEYLLENGTQQDIGGSDCGSAIPGTIGPKTTDNCLNQVQMQNEVPFVVMYTKDAC